MIETLPGDPEIPYESGEKLSMNESRRNTKRVFRPSSEFHSAMHESMKYKSTKVQNTFALLSEINETDDSDKPDQYEADSSTRTVKPT